MLTKFVCLANSYKEGGRCLAGVQLDNANNPVMINGKPKWIRPICNTLHNEVPTHLAEDIDVFDIVQLDVTSYPAPSYQSENAFFNENTLRVIGQFNRNRISSFCDNRPLIFGNRGKAVPEEKIDGLGYSLMLINTDNFEIIEKVYEDEDRPKTRLVFSYNENSYDLPITDPVFLHDYRLDPDILDDIDELHVTLSLGINFNDWYYKLVASIIY
jgi:hypothetical protein